jgi:excisionase family DNA binding protein
MTNAMLGGKQPLLLTVEEAAEQLRVHRCRLFPLMAQGRIRSLKIGRSRRIALVELERFIAEEMARQHGDTPPVA